MKKYNLKKDHEEIKKQIREWETCIDNLIISMWGEDNKNLDYIEELEGISQEMMSVNI